MGPRRTLTMVNRQCKGSSPGPGGPQPCPHTKPRHSLLVCTFLLASAKLTFLSFRHSFTDSIHFFFFFPAGRFPTHSPLYIRLTNRLSIIHPFHMTKPSQHTFIYSLICICPFLHTTQLSNKFIPHFINPSHT